MTTSKNLFKLLFSIGVCLLTGASGAIFTSPAIPTWYAQIRKPSFNPPNWLFGPVWTTLYIMMGIAAYLVWRSSNAEPRKKKALLIFLAQLALNALWTPLFFGLHNPLAGLVVIIILWLAILLTIILFWKISKTAGALLLPYLAWVGFATMLNASIFLLNR